MGHQRVTLLAMAWLVLWMSLYLGALTAYQADTPAEASVSESDLGGQDIEDGAGRFVYEGVEFWVVRIADASASAMYPVAGWVPQVVVHLVATAAMVPGFVAPLWASARAALTGVSEA